MTSIWTTEEIDKILIQLDAQNIPFKKYSLSKQGDKLELLGTGGYSRVYKANSRGLLKKECAIKVIGFGDKRVDSETFNKAAQAQIDLSQYQDYIVKVYDFKEIRVWIDNENNVTNVKVQDKLVGNEQGDNYINLQFVVMESLEPIIRMDKSGCPTILPELLAAGEEKEIQKLAFHIGMALERAHKNNLLHRDVKLENIFYDNKKKQYKLGDFGIAKLTDDGMASTVAFTKGYGAPEVVGALDEKYDSTADIYSFGMLLYILSNRVCFPESSNYNVNMHNQYSQGYVLPMPSNASEEFYEILVKMCSFDPDDRYQSMTDVLTDLDGMAVNKRLKYQREHQRAAFALGVIMLFAGIAAWKITFLPEIGYSITISMYIVLAISLFKGIQKIRKKDIYIISYILLGFGIYILISSGFTFWKLVLLLALTFSSGTFSSICAGAILLFDVMNKLEMLGYVTGSYQAQGYRWIAITLLSIAAVLFFHHALLAERDLKNDRMLFSKNLYWYFILLVFISLVVLDRNIHHGNWIYSRVFGNNVEEFLYGIGLTKIGIAGAVFTLSWILREKILIWIENREK